MQNILDNIKSYKLLVSEHTPLYESILDAIDIVKEFITSRRLIVYGGTAIDYALRLKGDAIYTDDMLKVPDLDFYSPTHTQDAYDLADILYQAGYTDARAIVALHSETFRVDIGDNNFIADISYCDPDIFKKLPTVNYNNMRVISPYFQYIDLHKSLSLPLANVPYEVIFERWKKDVERFEKLYTAYGSPSKLVKLKESLKKLKAQAKVKKEYLKSASITGSILENATLKKDYSWVPDDCIPVGVSGYNATKPSFDTLAPLTMQSHIFEYYSPAAYEHVKNFEAQGYTIRRFEPYFNILPLHWEVEKAGEKIALYDCSTIPITAINGNKPSIHIQLDFALSRHFQETRFQENSVYLEIYENLFPHRTELVIETIDIKPKNISVISQEMRIFNTFTTNPIPQFPINYYPARHTTHPEIVHSWFLKKSGKLYESLN